MIILEIKYISIYTNILYSNSYFILMKYFKLYTYIYIFKYSNIYIVYITFGKLINYSCI